MISDVPDDDPDVIASGPTVPDPTTYSDAMDIINKYGITEPAVAIDHLRKGMSGDYEDSITETPKHGDPRLAGNESILIATPQMSLEAAAEVAHQQGITPIILGDSIEGESSQVAVVHAGIAKQVVRHKQPLPKPCVLLSGGETTVTVKGTGRGGRNAEFSLALALTLNELPGVYSLAAHRQHSKEQLKRNLRLVTFFKITMHTAFLIRSMTCLSPDPHSLTSMTFELF